jgi:hypothetical protein
MNLKLPLSIYLYPLLNYITKSVKYYSTKVVYIPKLICVWCLATKATFQQRCQIHKQSG